MHELICVYVKPTYYKEWSLIDPLFDWQLYRLHDMSIPNLNPGIFNPKVKRNFSNPDFSTMVQSVCKYFFSYFRIFLFRYQIFKSDFFLSLTFSISISDFNTELTPARTHYISGLKSRVLKLTFSSLKMMVKSGLEFILKLTEPLQRYLLTCQAN